MFGLQNIKKYVKGGTTIVQDQVVTKHKNIPMPGIVDFKISYMYISFSVFTVADTALMDGNKKVCKGTTDLLGCLQNDARKIISAGPSKQSYMVSYLRKECFSKADSRYKVYLICFSVYHKFQPNEGSIGFSIQNDFKIVLNASRGYILIITDPYFGFPTSNPAAVPRTSLIINENRLVVIYLKVQFHLNLYINEMFH